MENKNYAIKTKNFDKIEFVIVSEDELADPKVFIKKALVQFGLPEEDPEGVFLWDRDNAPIMKDHFQIVVKQYLNSNSFFIRFMIKYDKNLPLLTQELKQFLFENRCKALFMEEEKVQLDNKSLSGQSLNALAKTIVAFIDSKFAETDINNDKIAKICHCTVDLFPSIKQEPSSIGGIDLLFDTKRRRGLIYNKIKYNKYQKIGKQEIANKMNELTLADDECETDKNEKVLTQEEELEYLLYFRTCIVSREKDILKIKLQKSIQMREKIIKKRDTVFHQSFPFYFLDPELICYDFEIRFPELKADSLLSKWPRIKLDILCSLPVDERDECLKYFDDEIGYFLALLKLVSQKPKFDERVSQFLLFTDNMNDKPEDLANMQSNHPRLIAFGPTKTKINQFYIGLEQHLIPLLVDTSFVQAFDCFFKTHNIFHLHYNPAIKNLLIFIDHYVFENGQSEGSISKKMHEVASKLKFDE